MADANAARPVPSLPRVLTGLALDYLRWTQLVPMLMAWAFLLVTVAAMLLVNFQQQAFDLIGSGLALYERIAGPPAPGEAAAPVDDAAPVTFTDADLRPLVMKAWALIALSGWLLGMAWRLLFGPLPRVSLRRKLAAVGLACLACTGLFLLAYFFGSEDFDDPFAHWLLLFVGAPLAVWCVSAYSLAVGALVDRLKRVLYRSGAGDPSAAR